MKEAIKTMTLAIACATLLTACGTESKPSADAPKTDGIIVIPKDNEVSADEAHMQESLTVKDAAGKEYTVNIDVDFQESENPSRRNVTSYISRMPNATEKEKYVKYMFGDREVYSGDVADLPREDLNYLLESDKSNYENYKMLLENNDYPENNEFYNSEVERLEAEIDLINKTLPNASSDYKVVTDYDHDVFISYNEDGYQECLEFILETNDFMNHKGYSIQYSVKNILYNGEKTDESVRVALIKDVLLNFDRNTEDIIDNKEYRFEQGYEWIFFGLPLYGDESKQIASQYSFEFMDGMITRFILHDNYVLEENEENVPLLPIDDIKAALRKELTENHYNYSNMGKLEIKSIMLDRYAIYSEEELRIELVPAWIIKTSMNQNIYIDATNGNVLPVVYEDAMHCNYN